MRRAEELLMLLRARPGTPGERGKDGAAGPAGPVTTAKIDELSIDVDLSDQVDGLTLTFDVLVDGIPAPFLPGKCVVIMGGIVQQHISFDGPGAQFTLPGGPSAPSQNDLGDGALRFIGWRA